MYHRLVISLLLVTVALLTFAVPQATFASGIVGTGTPASCTEVALDAALTNGGQITFNCGTAPQTITITTTKTIRNNTSIDGGSLISLSGGNTRPVISVNSNVTLNLANITIRDTGTTPFDIGETLYNNGTTNLVNTTFINNNRQAVFNQSGTMTITTSRFEGNTTSASGGAIGNESGGSLTVKDSTFINNRARDSQTAGAISNSSTLPSGMPAAAISGSTFNGNAAGGGGAVYNTGTMTINASTFTANMATEGGAIQAVSGAHLDIINTTLSGNTASGRGGGLEAFGPLATNAVTLTNVTLANNTAPPTAPNKGGGNIAVLGNATITLRNTIVATPAGSSVNCINDSTGTSMVIDGGNNLQFPAKSCGASITSTDPKLGSLQDNGGLTLTHALASDSPAINAADNATCPAFDQRGVVRPQANACDIGAFEYGAVPILSTITSPACGRSSGSAFTITVTGSNFIPGNLGSQIVIAGTVVPTTFISPTQLQAVVPAGLLTGVSGSSISVAVQTPVVDGGTSASQSITICHVIFLPAVQR